jgi:hypothetical protein
MPIVPNRATHPKRGNHYEIAHNTWSGVGPSATLSNNNTQFFDNKKAASDYGKGVSKLGYNVSVVKHSPESQDAGYTQGKVDHVMEAKMSVHKFFGPNPY